MSVPPSASCPATRRNVLAWTGAGLAAALGGVWPEKARAALPLPPTSGLGAPPGGSALLSRERFIPLLGTEFHLAPEVSSAPSSRCRLEEVSPARLSGPGGAPHFVTFSLLFTCPAPAIGEGGIRQLSHPAMPELTLFLSPVGKGGGVCHLEAVCSQRV